jgi:hypothetical protein
MKSAEARLQAIGGAGRARFTAGSMISCARLSRDSVGWLSPHPPLRRGLAGGGTLKRRPVEWRLSTS